MRRVAMLLAALVAAAGFPCIAKAQGTSNGHDTWLIERLYPGGRAACAMVIYRQYPSFGPGGAAKLELRLTEGGGLRIDVTQADVGERPQLDNARVGVTWIRSGPNIVASYPLSSYWYRRSHRPFTYIQMELSRPEEVRALVAAATGSRAVMIAHSRDIAVMFSAGNFAAVWAELRACGATSGAAPP